MTTAPPAPTDALDRLLRRTARTPRGCLIWLGWRDPTGYSRIYHEGITYYGHRLFWMLQRGEVSETLRLDHLCRVRSCVNVEHLEPVPVVVNNRRGRRTKLSADQVREIRARLSSSERIKDIAERFHVAANTISALHHRQTWADT